MDVKLRRGDVAARRAGAVAIGILEDERKLTGAAAAVDRATKGAIGAVLASRDFTGRLLETLVIYPRGSAARRVILVGLGKRVDLDGRRVRLASAQAARKARELRAGSLVTTAHGATSGRLDPERAAQSTAEGCVLGHYRFTPYKRDPGPPALTRVEIIESDAALAASLAGAVDRGARWAEATCLARDLANTPGQDLTPERLASRAKEIAKHVGAGIDILGVPQMERLGMGCVLAVGRGSVNPPRFIALEYPGNTESAGAARRGRVERHAGRGKALPTDTVVVIGKGVTFDTGGISIKPRENMHKMKYDMSGAAAVLGLFSALPSIAPPFRVVGLIPSAENMPGGKALKPGDIIRALDGTTIEVTNTDAEGRLLLADALGYARRYEPAAVVDLATLTGAITLALGAHAAGLFTSDNHLGNELADAAHMSGERLWPMPLWEDYAQEMKGDVADFVNSSGSREGGAILAAIFLKHFARGMRWAHLDIASTAWVNNDRPHEPRGATGFGARLLLEWISRRALESAAASSRGA